MRELNVYCEIHPFNLPLDADPRARSRAGIILSGGPSSLLRRRTRRASSPELFELGVPMLGICYGMQLTALLLGGKVGGGRRSASTAAPA